MLGFSLLERRTNILGLDFLDFFRFKVFFFVKNLVCN